MQSELELLAQSGKQIPSAKLLEAVEKTKKTIHTMWETSPSTDSDGREAAYKQIKGIDMVIIQLIRALEK